MIRMLGFVHCLTLGGKGRLEKKLNVMREGLCLALQSLVEHWFKSGSDSVVDLTTQSVAWLETCAQLALLIFI